MTTSREGLPWASTITGSTITGSTITGSTITGSTITGRVDVTTLTRDGQRQVVRTYLPADYEDSDRDYPVVYMFDGHNLFDRATSAFGVEWRIDETLTELQERGLIEGVVVVGMDSADNAVDRYRKYSVWDWTGPAGDPITATGAQTAQFLVDTVMPYVEQTYRVRRDRGATALGGSSMGGYMTLYTGARYTRNFGILLAFSPMVLPLPMRGDQLFEFLRSRPFAPGTRVYLDMGDDERLAYSTPEALVCRLWETRDLVARMGPAEMVARIIPGGEHNEGAWAARFAEVALWAFAGAPLHRSQ